jgi:FkbM family methyltransferase
VLTAHAFRAVPRFRGKGRAALVVGPLLLAGGADPIVYCKMAAGHRLRLDCRVQSHCRAYFSGNYDDIKISSLLSFLRPGGVAFDIGANIGFYTVPMARFAKERASKVIAVEPVKMNCDWLNANLTLNHCKEVVDVWAYGLSDMEAETEIVLAEDFVAGGSVGNAVIADMKAYGSEFKRATIRLRRLDDIWPKIGERIDIIKLDIEGHEGKFLAGGRDTISLSRPVILMEVNREHYRRQTLDFDTLIPNLLPMKYEYAEATPGGLRKFKRLSDCPDGDVLLIPSERLG